MGDLDLLGTLRDVGAGPAPAPSLSPVFFHRTLARWLGLPEGRGAHGTDAGTTWDFRVWRADFGRDPARDDGERLAYVAALREDADADIDLVARWWVTKDAHGRIVDAGWEGEPPRLRAVLGIDGDDGATSSISEADVARLIADDD